MAKQKIKSFGLWMKSKGYTKKFGDPWLKNGSIISGKELYKMFAEHKELN